MDYRRDLFFLLHSLMKKMKKLADNELHTLRIGSTEMRILQALYFLYPDGGDQEAIASQLDVDRSNAGRSLKKLEMRGYIKRKRNEDDGRAYRVSLTEKGNSIKEQILEIRGTIRKLFLNDISEKDLEHLTTMLEKADRSLSQENYDALIRPVET